MQGAPFHSHGLHSCGSKAFTELTEIILNSVDSTGKRFHVLLLNNFIRLSWHFNASPIHCTICVALIKN